MEKTDTTTRRLLLSIAASLLATLSGSAQLQDAPALFADAGNALVADAPDAAPIRSRSITVRTGLLAASDASQRILVAPFPDAVFVAVTDRLDVVRSGQYVWHGTLAGIEDGEATVSVTDGVAVGHITMPGSQYRIRYAGNGSHVVEQVDTTRLPAEHEPLLPDPADLVAPDPIPGQVADTGSVIDVMVVYTPSARAEAGGTAGIASAVNLAVANSNTAYANSGVTQRLRLVYSGEIAYTENPFDMQLDLRNLTGTSDGFMDGVHALRNTYRADFVALLTTGQDYCGIGYLMTTVSTAFASFAFNVSNWGCAMEYTLAHELGHNMGLHHDLANAGGQGAYPYAFGYQDPGFFRTVMAYPCSGASCPRIAYFSTPTRTYGGRPVGVANASENARALNKTAPTTANFRQSRRAPADVDGDGRTDLTVYRPATGEWFTRSSTTGYSYAAFQNYQWGLSTDKPLAGDFDGDGKSDLAVYRPSDGGWYIRYSSLGYALNQWVYFQWGLSSDTPLVGDFDGDGKTDLAVYRPSDGGWYIRYSSLGYALNQWVYFQWGLSSDTPLVGDFDGDGKTDLAVYRPSDGGWYIRYSSLGYALNQWVYFQWGLSTDRPLVGDFDGDGRTDLAVYRPSDGGWYIRYSSLGYAVNQSAYFQWGLSTDMPLAADFDGDGRTDLTVYRPSDGGWYIRYSSLGYAVNQWAYYQWGLSTDLPLKP